MKKMVSLFKRDWTNKECPAYDEIEEGAEWVVNGEGIATQKLDGTACMIKDGVLYRRLNAKKESPADFLHWSFDPEQRTGHGWIPVKDVPADKIHMSIDITGLEDGTYELCGEKVNKNPENIEGHKLIMHGSTVFENVPTAFNELKQWLSGKDIEGIVWHHKTGDMVKIKKSDFRMKRKAYYKQKNPRRLFVAINDN
jgi:hypothetical protein